MTKTEKILSAFKKNPNADVKKVAARFAAPVSMVYKLRKRVVYPYELAKVAPELLPVPDVTDAILNERATTYGKFRDGAALMQSIKRILAAHAAKHDKAFTDSQWEALEMIVHKMARIVNGDPNHVDSWRDIAGYAELVADELEGEVR